MLLDELDEREEGGEEMQRQIDELRHDLKEAVDDLRRGLRLLTHNVDELAGTVDDLKAARKLQKRQRKREGDLHGTSVGDATRS